MKILVLSDTINNADEFSQWMTARPSEWVFLSQEFASFAESLSATSQNEAGLVLSEADVVVVDLRNTQFVDRWTQIWSAYSSALTVPAIAWTGHLGDEFAEKLLSSGIKDLIEEQASPVVAKARIQSVHQLHKKHAERTMNEARIIKLVNEMKDKEHSILGDVDKLTGLMNRSWFERHLVQEWRRCYRHHSPLATVLVSVDDWHLFQNSGSLDEGERSLRRMGRWIQSILARAGDVVVRYSDHSFAVLLPDTDGEGAMHVAGNISAMIHKAASPAPTASMHGMLTVSMGVSGVLPSMDLDPHMLTASATIALEKSQQSGGDTVLRLDPVASVFPFPKAE